jgi:excisionase family DNA binding protein
VLDNGDLDALADALADRLTERAAAIATQRYFSVADAAVYTGLSQDSIRTLLAGARLTGYRPLVGRVLIDRRELDALIQASTRAPRQGRGHHGNERGKGGRFQKRVAS